MLLLLGNLLIFWFFIALFIFHLFAKIFHSSFKLYLYKLFNYYLLAKNTISAKFIKYKFEYK